MSATADPTFDTSEVKRLLAQTAMYNSEGRLGDQAASLLEEARFVAQNYEFRGEPDDEQKLRALVEPLTALRDTLVNEQEANVPWPKPSPLPPLTPPVPNLTPDLLPEPLRDWLVDAAARHSVHIEMIAVAAVVAAASLLGRAVGLHPKEYDLGWLETSNLWGAVVAPPSSRKTQAINEGMRFVRELQSELIEQHRDEQVGRGVKKEIAEMEIGQLKRKAAGAKGSPGSIETELVEKMQALQSYDVPEPRLYVNDTSVEKLGDLLAKNPRGLLFYRDELAGLLADMDKHGNEGQRAFMLEAWNGKGSYTFDRIGRGTLHIQAVNLSVIGGIQPGKLKPLVSGAIQGNTGADGLLQRFQLVAYPDRAPNWHRVDREPDKEAEARAFNIYRALMGVAAGRRKCCNRPLGRDRHAALRARRPERLQHVARRARAAFSVATLRKGSRFPVVLGETPDAGGASRPGVSHDRRSGRRAARPRSAQGAKYGARLGAARRATREKNLRHRTQYRPAQGFGHHRPYQAGRDQGRRERPRHLQGSQPR